MIIGRQKEAVMVLFVPAKTDLKSTWKTVFSDKN